MENKLNLPENFESYPEMRKRGFMRMKELKDNGAKVVGLFCSFVPLEIVYAAGSAACGPVLVYGRSRSLRRRPICPKTCAL